MTRRLFRYLLALTLMGGLISVSPTIALADEASNARGKKKKKKKKKSWFQKLFGKSTKKSNKSKKRVRKPSKYGKAYTTCTKPCRAMEKKSAERKACFKDCRIHKVTKKTKKKTKKKKSFFADIFMPGSVKKSRVEYTIEEGQAVTDGDILLGDPKKLQENYGKARLPGLLSKIFKKKKGSRGGAVISRHDYLWPNATIPYIIGRSVKNHAEADAAMKKIRDAAQHLSSKTALRLVEIDRASDAENYIEFIWADSDKFCASSLGMQGGRQSIVCNYMRKDIKFGTIVHEILHAAGFHHTQKRTDRAKYIRINPDNSCPGQFTMAKNSYSEYCNAVGGRLVGNYDIKSIMHYGSRQCAADDGEPSMTDRDGNPFKRNRKSLTDMDVKMINDVYTHLSSTSKTSIQVACWWEGKPMAEKRVVGTDGQWLDASDGAKNSDPTAEAIPTTLKKPMVSSSVKTKARPKAKKRKKKGVKRKGKRTKGYSRCTKPCKKLKRRSQERKACFKSCKKKHPRKKE